MTALNYLSQILGIDLITQANIMLIVSRKHIMRSLCLLPSYRGGLEEKYDVVTILKTI